MSETNPENNQQQTETPLLPAEVLSNLNGFGDIKLQMKVLLGSIKMPISQYLKITRGSIVELGKAKTDHLDVMVNGEKVADGEVSLSADSMKIAIEIVKAYKPKKF